MTPLLLEPSPTTAGPEATIGPRVRSSGPTLDELIAGSWRGLRSGQAAACPVCGETMRPLEIAAGVPRGSCTGCGSQLS